MGSCVSVHKDVETPMKLRVVVGSKNSMAVNPSPVKHERSTVNGVDCKVADHHPPILLPSPSRLATASLDFGSKEETFFDSQPYLESDCEDDFYSVKGDFTPSRGNTPVHQTISVGALKVNGSPFVERAAAISVPQTQIYPTEKKKRLAELFKESLGGDHEFNALDAVKDLNGGVPAKSAVGTPYSSACSNTTPSQELKHAPKSAKAGQCCLPKLLSRRSSFNERKKVASPAHSAG
nr:F-box domain containing protein [Ipomoea batatas]